MANRRGSASPIALLIGAALVVAGVIALFARGDGGIRAGELGRPAASAQATATPTASTSTISFTSSLVGYDATYQRTWGTSLSADLTDSLRFRASIHNDSQASSQTMGLGILHMAAGANGGRVGIAIGYVDSRGGLSGEGVVNGATVLLTSSDVHGYQDFDVSSATSSDVSYTTGQTGMLATSGHSSVEGSAGAYSEDGAFVLGTFKPKQTKFVDFDVYLGLQQQSDVLETGPDTVDFAVPKAGKFNANELQNIGAINASGPLAVSVELHNTGFRSIPDVRLRFTSKRNAAENALTLTLYAQLGYLGKEENLGSATINGATALAYVPKTTVIYGSKKGSCLTDQLLKRLPDGVSQAGVDVGAVDGFTPRDPCGSSEFDRIVNFEVAARV